MYCCYSQLKILLTNYYRLDQRRSLLFFSQERGDLEPHQFIACFFLTKQNMTISALNYVETLKTPEILMNVFLETKNIKVLKMIKAKL